MRRDMPFECPFCGRQYDRLEPYKRHRSRCDDACPHCGEEFDSVSAFESHDCKEQPFEEALRGAYRTESRRVVRVALTVALAGTFLVALPVLAGDFATVLSYLPLYVDALTGTASGLQYVDTVPAAGVVGLVTAFVQVLVFPLLVLGGVFLGTILSVAGLLLEFHGIDLATSLGGGPWEDVVRFAVVDSASLPFGPEPYRLLPPLALLWAGYVTAEPNAGVESLAAGVYAVPRYVLLGPVLLSVVTVWLSFGFVSL